MTRTIPDFDPVKSVWLCRPTSVDWPGRMQVALAAWTELVRACTEDTGVREVVLVVPSVETLPSGAKLRKSLSSEGMAKIRFWTTRTDRCWMRDMSPTWVREPDGNIHPVLWKFTGWAACRNHALDAPMAGALAGRHVRQGTCSDPVTAVHALNEVVLEGGAIDTDGKGTLLTTRECLLHPTVQVRNPGFDREAYEEVFRRVLGIERTIWLEGGILGDDTHGHVDDVARFVSPRTILCATADKGDENRPVLETNRRILKDASRIWEVRDVTIPIVTYAGKRLPASYLNFLILNDLVLVPTFAHVLDQRALRVIGEATGRLPVGIPSRDLVLGGGSLHCLSHTVPF